MKTAFFLILFCLNTASTFASATYGFFYTNANPVVHPNDSAPWEYGINSRNITLDEGNKKNIIFNEPGLYEITYFVNGFNISDYISFELQLNGTTLPGTSYGALVQPNYNAPPLATFTGMALVRVVADYSVLQLVYTGNFPTELFSANQAAKANGASILIKKIDS